MILPKFSKHFMKLRKIWAVEGAPAAPPLDPPLLVHFSMYRPGTFKLSSLLKTEFLKSEVFFNVIFDNITKFRLFLQWFFLWENIFESIQTKHINNQKSGRQIKFHAVTSLHRYRGKDNPFLVVIPEFSLDMLQLKAELEPLPANTGHGKFPIGSPTPAYDAQIPHPRIQTSV